MKEEEMKDCKACPSAPVSVLKQRGASPLQVNATACSQL